MPPVADVDRSIPAREFGSDMTETRSSPLGEQRAPVDPSGEIRRLQSCISDLIAVQAVPAIWTGHDASVGSLPLLLEAHASHVQAGLRLRPSPGHTGRRRSRCFGFATGRRPPSTGARRDRHSSAGSGTTSHYALNESFKIRSATARSLIAPLRLGAQVDTGVLVVGWERAGFLPPSKCFSDV